VYRRITSLRHYSGMATLLLSTEWLSLMDTKHVGVLTHHLFLMLDLTNSFEDTKFRRSISGQRLRAWSDLPDNPMIHGIWQKSPRQTTYFWFQSLQSLCLVFQIWIKNSRYHPTQGFIEARDNHQESHIVVDSTTPSPVPDQFNTLITAMNQYDVTCAIRWYQTSPHGASCTNPTPRGHCPAMSLQRQHAALESPSAPNKKARIQAVPQAKNNTRLVKDFVSLTLLLETILPLNMEMPISTQLLERIPKGMYLV
jgi:hypothetical protein